MKKTNTMKHSRLLKTTSQQITQAVTEVKLLHLEVTFLFYSSGFQTKTPSLLKGI